MLKQQTQADHQSSIHNGRKTVQETSSQFRLLTKSASLLVGLLVLAFTVILSIAESPAPPPAASDPTRHALLIGVSAYPKLDERYQLKDGPRNDVKLMQTVLQSKGFSPERITVLADGVKGSVGDPTRAAILDGLTALSERVKPGDYAVVYYSGHGSQQPVTEQTTASEPDGLDETLLPSDVGKWNDAAGVVDNAIIDNEIETRLTALRQRERLFWLCSTVAILLR